MKKVKYIFFVIFLFIASFSCYAQMDNEFWFAPPNISEKHGDTSIYLVLTGVDFGATVAMYQHAIDTNPTMIPVYPGYTIKYILDKNKVETKPPGIVKNTGIHIKVLNGGKINCFYEIAAPNNADIFTLKGKDALGTVFYIPSQNIFSNDIDDTNFSDVRHSFDIVATENNTTITIYPTQDLLYHPAGIPFSITLNKGQTYSCEGSKMVTTPNLGYSAEGHLCGTKVTSNKPIAITVKDDSPQTSHWSHPTYQLKGGDARDLLGEQIVPIEKIGTEYIILRGKINNYKTGIASPGPDFYFITATENGTDIYINGSLRKTINEKETHGELISHDTLIHYISTNKPVYLWHVSGIGDKLAGTIIPPMECTGSKKIGVTRTTSEKFILNIITIAGFENSITLDGVLINTISGLTVNFNNVPGSTKYKAAQIEIPTSVLNFDNTKIIASNTNTPLQVGILSSGKNSCRYTYPSGYTFFNMDILPSKPNFTYCVNDTLNLSFEKTTGIGNINYIWIAPTGDTIKQGFNANELTIPNIDSSDAGIYTLSLSAPSIYCSQIIDSIHISVIAGIKPNIGIDQVICDGDSTLLTADKNYESYKWSTGSSDSTIWVTKEDEYVLKATKNGCIGYDTVLVKTNPLPTSDFWVTNNSLCFNDSIEITIKPDGTDFKCEIFYTINSQKVFSTSFANGEILVKSFKFPPVGKGVYEIVFTNKNNCISRDTFNIYLSAPLVNLGADKNLCSPSTQLLEAPIGYQYLWNTGEQTKQIIASNTNTYWVVITDTISGCKNSDSIQITIHNLPNITITASKTVICPGEDITLSANGAKNYNWSSNIDDASLNTQTSSQSINISPKISNTYYVQGTDTNGCENFDSISITVMPAPKSLIQVQPERVSILEPKVILKDISQNIASRYWDLGDGTTANTEYVYHTYTTLDTTSYTVMLVVTNLGGCSDTAYKNITIYPETTIYVPNAFIPNDDGHEYNVFKVFGSYIYDFELTIYDKWGKKVFYSKDINKRWDGTYAGNPLPASVYTYIISYRNHFNLSQMKKGTITLIR